MTYLTREASDAFRTAQKDISRAHTTAEDVVPAFLAVVGGAIVEALYGVALEVAALREQNEKN